MADPLPRTPLNDSRNANFSDYWRLRAARLEAAKLPRPVLRSFETSGLDGVESLLWNSCREASRILDVGAGDKRIKRKFRQQGFAGEYITFDVSPEYEHDFYTLEEITGAYDAVLMLEIIEHISLPQFYHLMRRVCELLTQEGTIIVSTPNPACITSMWAGDMTHIQQYPLNDLIAFLTTRGFNCEAYRVLYSKEHLSLSDRLRLLIKKGLATQILGCDYAEGLVVVGRRAHPR